MRLKNILHNSLIPVRSLDGDITVCVNNHLILHHSGSIASTEARRSGVSYLITLLRIS
jgi:hypothetical protein